MNWVYIGFAVLFVILAVGHALMSSGHVCLHFSAFYWLYKSAAEYCIDWMCQMMQLKAMNSICALNMHYL